MMRSKRKLDDETKEQRESKSRNWIVQKGTEHDIYCSSDNKIESESNTRPYHNKDDRRRDDYSRLARSRGHGNQDVERQRKDDEPRHESRNQRYYEKHDEEKRHTRDEEDCKERRYQRDRKEDDERRRRGKDDRDEQHGSRRHRSGEEEERGSRGHERDKRMD